MNAGSTRRAGISLKPPYVLAGMGLTFAAVLWAVFLMPASLGGSTSFVIVNGPSMQPALQDGDLAILRRQRFYNPGEIVAFRAGGGMAIHRIESVLPDGTYVTKGDNKDRADPWLPGDTNVVGKVVLTVPRVGGVVQDGGALVFGLLVGALVTIALFWPQPAQRGRATAPLLAPEVPSPAFAALTSTQPGATLVLPPRPERRSSALEFEDAA